MGTYNLNREFDKNPDMFFRVMMELKDKGVTNFRLSVLGDGFQDNPEIFSIAKNKLSDHILHWGFLATKSDYYNVLGESDVVISTASHEFFGVAMYAVVCFYFPTLYCLFICYGKTWSKRCIH